MAIAVAITYSAFMLYRMLRSINNWYAIGVLWLFVLAFLLAFGMIFVFPQVTLVLVFLGLGGLGMAVLGSRVLHSAQYALARHSLKVGVCPACKELDQQRLDANVSWICSHCGASFSTAGEEASRDESADSASQQAGEMP